MYTFVVYNPTPQTLTAAATLSATLSSNNTDTSNFNNNTYTSAAVLTQLTTTLNLHPETVTV